MNHDKVNQLQDKLETLLKRQNDFSKEINNLRIEIMKLRASQLKAPPKDEIKEQQAAPKASHNTKEELITPVQKIQEQQTTETTPNQPLQPARHAPKKKSDLEKFVGENLINKIGIAITIIGVAIGAKYSIEHDLIRPLTRIILGYSTGVILLGFGIKLKRKYENYSAVLVSGAIAIMYFITYIAYGFYDLMPQTFAFILMVILTAFTIIAAINYNNQVIAHIGMVGAYAVPFLLGDDSGNYTILFSYMAIINIGILIISFKRYWKSLYYSSFGLTWLIFTLWYVTKYASSEHLLLALVFLTLFFLIFYLTFLAYKLLRKEKFEMDDIFLLLFNSFIFYGMGYAILSHHETGEQFLGLFTLCNAIVHFVVSAAFYKQKLADKNLFYLSTGLVLVFITIAIPVQLDGNWVTLLWVSEATLLFWIGRTKNISIYEKLSYPLMFLAFFSIIQDWSTTYDAYTLENKEAHITPFLNINFLSSMLFIIGFGLINIIKHNKNYISALAPKKGLSNFISFSIPTLLILTIYFAFRIEISTYWNQLYTDSSLTISSSADGPTNYYTNLDLIWLKSIWIINYSLLFISLLVFVNNKKIKNLQLGMITFGFIALTLVIFLTQGLYALSELRESYLNQTLAEYFYRGTFNIGIRYISYIFVAFTLFAGYKYISQEYIQGKFTKPFDFLLHISILWIASSELINLMELTAAESSYKLGLSVLWGIYSLFLIAIGIWKKKKYLRIGAIVWFGITLVKLFTYDISHLNTIAKTIVFVSLGVLLLIISFLYNKYKHIISDESTH